MSREAATKTFTTKLRIYWSDCDPAGIMYFGNIFKYFEIAEEDFFGSLGRSRAEIFEQTKIGFPRVETWARFRKPLAHGAGAEVTLWIEKRTEQSLLYCFEVRAEDRHDLLMEGSYWVVCIQRSDFRPIPLPPEIVKLLKDYLPPVSRRSREHGDYHPHRDVAP